MKKLVVGAAVATALIVGGVVLMGILKSDLSRSQVHEAMILLLTAREPLSDFRTARGKWPLAADEVVGNTSGKYTARVAITTGAGGTSGLTLTATMKGSGVDSRIAGKTVQVSTEDGKKWVCRSGDTNGVDPKYLPTACRP